MPIGTLGTHPLSRLRAPHMFGYEQSHQCHQAVLDHRWGEQGELSRSHQLGRTSTARSEPCEWGYDFGKQRLACPLAKWRAPLLEFSRDMGILGWTVHEFFHQDKWHLPPQSCPC